MPEVTIELPSLLGHIVNGDRRVCVEAQTVQGAVEALVERFPALSVHLFDETGNFRQHVLCFHNQVNTRWMSSTDVPVTAGDTITILQAVSGG